MTDDANNLQAPQTRVLLVDDHDLFRTGLRNLLEEQGVQVVGECDNGTEALHAVRELAPDVVVMDLNMPGISGVEATRQISMIAPLTRCPSTSASTTRVKNSVSTPAFTQYSSSSRFRPSGLNWIFRL